MITTADLEALAAACYAEARRHPPRTPQRRAACHAWSSLITSPSIAAARKAVSTFGTPEVQRAALDLMHRLAAETRPSLTNCTTTED